MLKKIIACLCSLLFIVSLFSVMVSGASDKSSTKYINNADVMPKYRDDSQVTLDEYGSPDWLDELIIVHCAVSTRSPDGTLAGMTPILDHFQEVGINGLLISPLADFDWDNAPPYTNYGWDTIHPKYTGKDDFEESLKVVKEFVDECHKRNIRLILDFTTWGLSKDSHLFTEHPDWFAGFDTDGVSPLLKWSNTELQKYYADTLVHIALETGADGLRYDSEPIYAGYGPAKEIKSRLIAAGRKMLFLSEQPNDRLGSYDLEQFSVKPPEFATNLPFHFFLTKYNIVETVKTGSIIGTDYDVQMGEGGNYHYYTCQLSSHDCLNTAAQGNPLVLAYQGIYSPFIPLWEIGEEFNNPFTATGHNMWLNPLDWSAIEANRDYFEQIKQAIRIRWTYPQLFKTQCENFKESNICKVIADGVGEVQAYARYRDNQAMLIVPNNNTDKKSADVTTYIPFDDAGISGYKSYTVTDVLTGKVLASGSAKEVKNFKTTIDYQEMGVYLVTGSNEENQTSTDTDNKNNNSSNKVTIKEVIEYIKRKPTSNNTPVTENNSDNTNDNNNTNNNENKQNEKNEIVNSKDSTDSQETEIPVWVWIVAGALVVIGGSVAATVIVRKKKSSR